MRFRVVPVGVALFAIGCSLVVDASDLGARAPAAPNPDASAATETGAVATDGGVTDGGAADVADGADGGSTCPVGRGPKMVRITDSIGSFCIDSTEVTNAEFNAFVADPARPSPPSLCSYRTTYGGPLRPPDALPVTDVDWCEAWMFCAWAGKRLCGSRTETAIADFGPANDPKISEWFAACTQAGKTTFAYGDAATPLACNGCDQAGACVDGGPGAPLVAAGSLATCEGGYPGIFDMNGNVAEWEDNCVVDTTLAPDQLCPPRGGDRTFVSPDLHCVLEDVPAAGKRGARSPNNGIRCCAD